jgi:hypothetical protein
VTSIAAKCCTVYPHQTGTRAESVKDDVAFVAVHFKQFSAFFAHAWPALKQRNQNFVLYTFGNDDNMPWEFFQCHGLGHDRLRAFLGAPQLRGWFTQNLDAARSPNKRRGHSRCADELMRSWPKYDSDLDATLRAKLHFVPVGIKILTGGKCDGNNCRGDGKKGPRPASFAATASTRPRRRRRLRGQADARRPEHV